MKAVILCAGEGTRLRSLTNELPKVMLPIAGKPILQHHIEYYKRYSITDIYINLHHLPGKIVSYFKEGGDFGVDITYSYEKKLLGTAGALNGFRQELESGGAFFVHYGDVLSEVDLEKMLAYHGERESVATLAIHPSSHPQDSDIVTMNEGGRITRLYHKPGTLDHGNLGNGALYLLEPKILQYLPQEGEHDFIRDVFPRMLEAGEPLYGYSTDEFLKDMGTPKRYQEVKRRLEGDNFADPFQD